MQVPGAGGAALAVNPQQRFIGGAGDEIIARHVGAVPPPRLDPLRPGQQLQRPVMAGDGSVFLQSLWPLEQPERPQIEIEGELLCAGLGPSAGAIQMNAGAFRAVVGACADAVHRCGTQARAQALDQARPIALLLQFVGEQVLVGICQRFDRLHFQGDSAHRLGQRRLLQPLAQQQREVRGLAAGCDQTQLDPGGGRGTVRQADQQLPRAGGARREKPLELQQQPLRRKQQGFGLRGLGRQFDGGAKLLRQDAKATRIGQAAEGLVQRIEQALAKAARKPSARQRQQIADAAGADG